MPALVKSRVGSFWGTSEEEATRRWLRSSRNLRNASRIWEAVRAEAMVWVYATRGRLAGVLADPEPPRPTVERPVGAPQAPGLQLEESRVGKSGRSFQRALPVR